MIYLLLSIILSTYLTLSFKVLQKLNIPILPAIVFNYIFCVLTGSIVNGNLPYALPVVQAPWFKWAIVMGVCFISLFNVIGHTTQKIGVAVSSVSNKLSMVVSVIFFIVFFNESYNYIKILGILLALIAVVCTCYSKPNSSVVHSKLLYLLPILLFIGSGFLDTLFKWISDTYIKDNEQVLNNFLISGFGIAGGIGLVLLAIQYVVYGISFTPKAILAGLCIGVPNYFSIYYLGMVYKANLMESSAIIPVNNMLIVLVSTLAAVVIFKEKLSKINWIGILLAIIAIALIALNKHLTG